MKRFSLSRLFGVAPVERREPTLDTPVPVPLPVVPVALEPPRRTRKPKPALAPTVVDADVDFEDVDLDACVETAATTAFLDWHYTSYALGSGLRWGKVWARYQVYCVTYRLRPLSPGKLKLELQPAGVGVRRPRIAGRRVTVYDILGRAHLIRKRA